MGIFKSKSKNSFPNFGDVAFKDENKFGQIEYKKGNDNVKLLLYLDNVNKCKHPHFYVKRITNYKNVDSYRISLIKNTYLCKSSEVACFLDKEDCLRLNVFFERTDELNKNKWKEVLDKWMTDNKKLYILSKAEIPAEIPNYTSLNSCLYLK